MNACFFYTHDKSTPEWVKMPTFWFFAVIPALASDLLYPAKFLILTSSFMAGNENPDKMGFIPIELFLIRLNVDYVVFRQFYILYPCFFCQLQSPLRIIHYLLLHKQDDNLVPLVLFYNGF